MLLTYLLNLRHLLPNEAQKKKKNMDEIFGRDEFSVFENKFKNDQPSDQSMKQYWKYTKTEYCFYICYFQGIPIRCWIF